MSVDIYVEGIVSMSLETVQVARDTAKALEKLKVKVPKEVQNIIDAYEAGNGVSIKHACDGEVEYDEGMVIDLTKLPPNVRKLRIYMR